MTLEITPIELEDEIGVLVFYPQPDIGTWDCAMISALLFKLTLNTTGHAMAWRNYLIEHNLLQHFRAKPNKPPA